MHKIADQALLALTCYNEEKFESFCRERFPNAVFHKRITDTEFFGWLDHGNGCASVFMEGTHGKTAVQKIVSWAGNLAASDNDGNGQHDGFQMLANQINTLIGYKLLEFKTLYFFGHSRACSVLAILAYLLKMQKLSLNISGRVFCPPAPGNADFAKAFNKEIPDWKYYRMMGDLINTGKMRNASDSMLDGVDCGFCEDLPDVGFIQHIPGLRLFAHSPRRICRSLIKKYPAEKSGLQWVRERCVN